MKRLIWIILIVLPATIFAQTNYYVSSSEGSDSNTGKSENQAWKTLDKVNSFKPNPGDKILFKRDDEWVGTIKVNASGTANKPILYGAYGSGNKPKIYGSEVITGWELYEGNIYKTTTVHDITQIFYDDVKYQAARTPNTGYYHIDKVVSPSQFKSNDISSGVDLTGALWVGRTKAWAMSSKKITGTSSDVHTLAGAPAYSLGVNEGFILLNKLEFLDQAGEWVYDSNTNTLYVKTPSRNSPSNYTIRGAYAQNGIHIGNNSYITVQNMQILHVSGNAVSVGAGHNVILSNLSVKYYGKWGAYFANTSNSTLTNCEFVGGGYGGVKIPNGNNCVFIDNVINDAGLLNGITLSGAFGSFHGTGFSIVGNSCILRYNKLTNITYNGISFRGRDFLIEKNYLRNSCIELDDGAAIYTYNAGAYSESGSSGTIIQYNIIDNVPGNKNGYTSRKPFGMGIYTDERSRDIVIQHNTITEAVHSGVYLNISGDIDINNNIIFNCGTGYISTYPNFSFDFNSFTNNIVCNAENTKGSDGTPARLARAYYNKWTTSFDHNTYVDHWRSTSSGYGAPFSIFSLKPYGFTFSEWKSKTGQDLNSTFDNSSLAEGETEKLFYNDTKQKKTFDFGNKTYKDIYGNSVTGSITLDPFTSMILIGTSFDHIQGNNQSPIIHNQSFEINGDVEKYGLIGQVVADDPDVDQNLSFTIIERNDENLFSIDNEGRLIANADLSVNSNKSYDLTIQVTDDDATPLSANAVITITLKTMSQDNNGSNTLDTTAPTISSFSIPSTSTSLTIDITTFSASDDNEVTGYLLSISSSTPDGNNNDWKTAVPTSYTFSQEGAQDLYAWVKDAAGNVSSASSATVNITLPELKSTSSEYLFEEESGITVVDSKGNVDGTIKNEELRVKGVNGNGIQLTGKGYINLGKSYLARIKEEVTLSAWIKPASEGYYQGVIMHGGPNTDSFALYVNPNEKSIGFKTSGTTNQWTTTNAATLWDGDWHQIAVTYDGNQKIIYIDGEKKFNIEATGIIESGEGYNCLIGKGRDNTEPDHNYSGLIDEARIFNTALKSSEIADLYNQIKNKITEVNQNPVISDHNFEITQTKYPNDFIGKVNASDPNLNQNVTFSITNGNEEGLFTINANTGEITANKTITPSVTKSYVLVVQVTDDSSSPLSASANVTVNLRATNNTNANNGGGSDNSNGGSTYQNQRPSIANQSFEINDIKEINDVIGKVQATDPDQDQTITYSILEGNEDGLFSINLSTGEIYANKTIYTTIDQTVTLLIKVKDNATNSLSATATVNITLKAIRINQKPEVSSQTFNIREEIEINNLIGQIAANDPDEDQNLTYSIIGGNEEGLFVIDANTGEIITKSAKSITVDQTIVLVVKVTDNDETSPLTATANITINLFAKCILEKAEVNVDDPQRVILYFSKSLDENLIISETINDFSLSHEKSIHHISFQDSIIYLDIDPEYQYGDTITVNYTKGVTTIFDVSGNEIKSFTNCPVDNNLIQTDEINIGENMGELEVLFYPNPTNGIVNIKANYIKSDVCEVALFSTMGNLVSKRILTGAFGSLEESINMSHLSRGTYILQFVCGNQNHKGKIVIM